MDVDENYMDLLKRYYDEIYRYIRRICFDKELVEDIVQETFCEAFLKKAQLFEHPNQVGWLYRVAQLKMMELHRKNDKLISINDIVEEFSEDSNYRMVDFEHDLSLIIPKEDIVIIKRYYMQGYTAKELAAELGITESAFKVKIHRMKLKVKNVWEGDM